MDKDLRSIINASETIDLSLWREFQDGLTALLDIPISLYDSRGVMLCPPSRDTSLCNAMKLNSAGCGLCGDIVLNAVSQVLDKGKPYIHKCHANQYIFAIPAFLDSNVSLVVLGGHAYLEGSHAKEFYDGFLQFGFDDAALDMLKGEIRTIPAEAIFTIPNTVSNLAIPFLKSLYSRSPTGRIPSTMSERDRLKSFHALEQVYRSIAPLLDREELYETILSKSSELVDAERGSLMILDNKENVLSVKAAKGIDKSIVNNLRIRVGEGISGQIAAKGVPVIVKNIEDEVPHFKSRPVYRTKSFISIPLKLDTRVIGVINVSDKISSAVFSDEDLHLLLSFANYASIALERGAYYSMSEELKVLSMTDPLTGLFNRRYFRERLFEEMERVKRHGECFTAFLIDIDNFKVINDRYGHIAGDEIIKGVARTIRDAVRSMDVVARYGGEEFAVILPHTNKKDSFVIAERIRKSVEEHDPAGSDLDKWPTISLGVAEYPDDAHNIEDLINKADKAMYAAKKTGKNKVVVYEP